MRLSPQWTARLISSLAKLLFLTLRLHVEDRSTFVSNPPPHPVLFTFWHNRILAITLTFLRRYPRDRKGVSVLTSPSRDGQTLAGVMRYFGMQAVFGSNNKRPATAVQNALGVLKSGRDLAITPDGPRGPRYHLHPGVVYLSQETGLPILPMHVRFSRCIQLKSWDKFCIPLPFSKIYVKLGPYEYARSHSDASLFEEDRQRIETQMTYEAD